jgi:hypothetical protein
MNEQGRIWFKAKRYGWGWGLPTAWQGWAVYAAYVLLTVGGVLVLLPGHRPAFIAALVALTALLVAVCWRKGEKPGWHWGGQ